MNDIEMEKSTMELIYQLIIQVRLRLIKLLTPKGYHCSVRKVWTEEDATKAMESFFEGLQQGIAESELEWMQEEKELEDILN